MPDTGYNHGAGTHLHHSAGTDIDETAIADNGTLTTDVEDNDVLHGCYIGVKSVEDNTGACDGNVTFYVLGNDADEDGVTYENPMDDTPIVMAVIDQGQNKTHVDKFYVRGDQFPLFKIHCLNQAGQQIAVSINKYQITVPPAS